MVEDSGSSLYGQRPAPRVIQNQGDLLLERYVADQEVLILKTLQSAMRGTKRKSWVVIFTTVLILLLIRERDIWRLLYWIHNPTEVGDYSHL